MKAKPEYLDSGKQFVRRIAKRRYKCRAWLDWHIKPCRGHLKLGEPYAQNVKNSSVRLSMSCFKSDYGDL